MNATSERAISTLRLSEFLSFVKPQIALDGKNQLHILYLGSPEIFVETTVNQDGRLIGTQYFKRAGGRTPRFVPFSNGTLKIAGGIPYDPEEEAAKAPKARRASERPE
jgi:hypothetical protein